MYIPLSLKFLPLCFQNFHSPLPQPQPQVGRCPRSQDEALMQDRRPGPGPSTGTSCSGSKRPDHLRQEDKSTTSCEACAALLARQRRHRLHLCIDSRDQPDRGCEALHCQWQCNSGSGLSYRRVIRWSPAHWSRSGRQRAIFLVLPHPQSCSR